MSSDSSASVNLDRKRVCLDPNVTLARASDHAFDAYVPTGVPLVGRSDRQPSGASSSEIELPTFRPEVAPPMETEPISPRSALGDSTEGESSYANPESSSRGSDDSGRVDTDEGTSGAGKRSLVNFQTAKPKSPGSGLGHGIRLDDTNDVASTMTVRLVNALKPASGWEGISIIYPQANDRPWSPPSGYICVYECFIKNGGLCFPVPRLLLQYCHRRRIPLSQLTHGSMRTMMVVVVLAAVYGGVVNLDEFEEISSFSSMGNTGRFYVSPRGGYQLVAGHSSQVTRFQWSRYFYVDISRRTIGEFSRPIRVGWNFRPVEPVKRKTSKDSIITLLRKNKSHIRQWPDFLSYRIARSYPRFSSGDFYLPLEDNSPDIPQSSNKKSSSNRKQKGSTPAKRKNVPAQSRPKKSSMVKLNLDVVDSDEECELPRVDPLAQREGLRSDKTPITHGRDKGLMGGLLAESRRGEEARLEKERWKEDAKRKSRDEEKKKKAEDEAKRRKRADEEKEKEKARSAKEKKRSAQEALGSRDRVEKVARFNTVGLPVERRRKAYLPSSLGLSSVRPLRSRRTRLSFSASYRFFFQRSSTQFAMYAVSNRKLNTQNGELVAESSRSKEARTRAESEVVKVKDLLSHSKQMNGELIASRDELSSKVAALTSALAKAEEAKKDEVSRIEGEVAELRSSSKVAVARAVEELSDWGHQKDGEGGKGWVPIDAAKKEKLEAPLASYIAEADSIVLPSLPTDSSDGEETEPKKNVALDISSSDSSDEEAERSEVDGRTSVAGKTPALTLAEIEEAANVEAEQVNQLTAELFGDQGEAEGDAGVPGYEDRVAAEETAAIEEPASIEAPASFEEPSIDAATGQPIAPLFPDSNLEEPETAS
ncbi:hypothetical protein AALP_AA2G054600 [Arabis alpina]|uniref:Uncharacterized protein n=1 Tax=Arabis alpina TaxID=50452 RepID=A0A087HFI0_ARAAL|nr:hypothetical protein AALP_AA2G054600 [Arabis alpina]